MATLIPVGTGESDSSDFVLTIGTPKTFYMTAPAGKQGAPNKVRFLIQRKSGTGDYLTVFTIDADEPAVNVEANGTFRARREAPGEFPAGLDYE